MDGLDRRRRVVHLAPIVDEDGRVIIPRRTAPYDTLVLAVGCICNDFRTPGVDRRCMFLDTRQQAEQVQRRLLNACCARSTRKGPCSRASSTSRS